MGSAEILAGEEGLALLLLLLVEGDLVDRLEGVAPSSAATDTSRSLRSSASILYCNISNPYIRMEQRS